jgi:hypothetical protein
MDDEIKALQEKSRRVVCSAIRFENGPMIVGARHFDQHMHVQCEYMGIKGTEPHTDGFIDQYGNFLTRSEAWKIAKRQNQIVRLCAGQSIHDDDDWLWSENLY